MTKSNLLKQYRSKLDNIKATTNSERAAICKASDIMTGINLATENKYENEVYALFSEFVHEVAF